MAQSYSLTTPQKVLWGVFLLYLASFVIDKTDLTINGRASNISVTFGNLRTVAMWAFAIIFLWYMYSLGPKSPVYEHSVPSGTIIAFILIIFGLQSFTKLDLKSQGNEKFNEYGKFESNMFWIYFLYIGSLVLNWWFLNKNGTGLIMSGMSAIIVLIYLTYVSVATRNTKTLNKLYTSESALSVPMIGLFAITILYFAIYSNKAQFLLADQPKITELLKMFLLYLPPVFLAYQMGTCVSDTLQQQKMLVVSKIQNILKMFDTSWVYYDIVNNRSSKIIDSLVSTEGKPLSGKDIHGQLIVTTKDELELYDIKASLPLDLWQQMSQYIKAQKNRQFDISDYFNPNKKNTNPSKKSGALAPINVGILMLFITSVMIVLWGAAFYWSKLYKSLSIISWVLALVAIGIIAYAGYLFRNTSQIVDSRNEVYCMQYNMDYATCEAAKPQFEQTTFFLLDRVNSIINGTGVITINNYTLFDGAPLTNDTTGNRNMKSTYTLLSTYPTSQTSISDSVQAFRSAYARLIKYVTEINLKISKTNAGVKIYTGSPETVTGNVLLNSITLKNIYDICTDSDYFAQSIDLSPYSPNTSQTFNTDNEYFGLYADPSTQIVALYFKYEGKGQQFKDDLKIVLFTKYIFNDLTYAPSVDCRKTFNPRLALSLYSGNFDIDNLTATYISHLKTAMKAVLQKNILGTINNFQESWTALSSPKAEWSVAKLSMTSTQYDLINSVVTSKASSQDQVILTDVLMHAIVPRSGVLYDDYIDDYLSKLFWVVKLELTHDSSQVTTDINTLEKTNISRSIILLTLCLGILVIYVWLSMKIQIDSTDYFSDYFKTSIAGSKLGQQHNAMLIVIILTLIIYNLYNNINLYLLENKAVSSMMFSSKPVWGGKITTISLVVSVCSILGFIPLFYRNIADRGSVYFITLILTAMMSSPLVYFFKQKSFQTKIGAYRKFNSVALIAVCCSCFFLIISGKPDNQYAKYFKYGLYAITVILAAAFVSLPTMFLEATNKNITDDELEGRLEQINLGVVGSLITYLLFYWIYFSWMKKQPLFTNTITKVELPKSIS